MIKIPFVRHSGLAPRAIIFLFLVKIAASCFYGWLYQHHYAVHADTWEYFHESLIKYYQLKWHPLSYFRQFPRQFLAGTSSTDFLGSQNTIWMGSGEWLLVHGLAVCDLFSAGNYYVDCIFYSWVTFFGIIAFYRLFKSHFDIPSPVILWVLYFPSVLFWGSGIHKDGILFLLVGMLLYCWSALLENKYSPKKITLFILSMIGILIIRNYILVLLLPPLIAWYISEKWVTNRNIWVFVLTYLCTITFCFSAGYINASFNFPQKLIDRQQGFYTLQGNSRLSNIPLRPTFTSFLSQAPKSIAHVLFHPYFSTWDQPLYLWVGLENMAILFLFINMCLHFAGEKYLKRPLLLFSIFFGFSLVLLIGYIVPFLGAIVRYRALSVLLLLLVMISLTDWKKMGWIKGIIHINS